MGGYLLSASKPSPRALILQDNPQDVKLRVAPPSW